MNNKSAYLTLVKFLSFFIINKDKRKNFRSKHKSMYFYKKHNDDAQQNYSTKLQELYNKNKISVAFFIVQEQMWKSESVYKEMIKDDLFEPVIVVIPYTVKDKKTLIETSEQTFNYFKEHNYNVVQAYDKNKDSFIDISQTLNPDIVFFSTPYNQSDDLYHIETWSKKSLTCYIPYALVSSNLYHFNYNQNTQNLTWKNFYESDFHKEIAIKSSSNKGTNVESTGYPHIDILLSKRKIKNSPWKDKTGSRKKIIWSPHHSIVENGPLDYSCFLPFHNTMLKALQIYKNDIEICFKPHPLLKKKLYELDSWGKEATDLYYKKWEDTENANMCNSDYIDLFQSSNAMINTSGSFTAEYLYLKKPSLFIIKNKHIKNQFNSFGKEILKYWEHAKDEKEIFNFIEKVINDEVSKIDISRNNFVDNHLLKGNKTASQKIIKIIKDSIKKN